MHPSSKVLECHLYLAGANPSPDSSMIRDEFVWYPMVLQAPVVAKPPPANGVVAPLSLLVLAVVPSVACILFFLVMWTFWFMFFLIIIFLSREASDNISSMCSTADICLHLHPFPVVRYGHSQLRYRPQDRPDTTTFPCLVRPHSNGPQ